MLAKLFRFTTGLLNCDPRCTNVLPIYTSSTIHWRVSICSRAITLLELTFLSALWHSTSLLTEVVIGTLFYSFGLSKRLSPHQRCCVVFTRTDSAISPSSGSFDFK